MGSTAASKIKAYLYDKQNFQIGSLYVLIFLSGFAGLGYEMVWTRMLAAGLGHEINAVLAVIGAFFSGLALGAYALDGIVSRSPVPGRWYGILEIIIGSWSLVLIILIPWTNNLAASLIGIEPSAFKHWTVAFLLPFILFLPATFAMGGTLPAMERLFSRLRQDDWSVGGLYAANTFGAVAGTMMTTFVIVSHIGFRASLILLAAANFICAAGVLGGAARDEGHRAAVFVSYTSLPSGRRLWAVLFFTGLLGIGYEVLVVRVISQVLENTVYSFTCVLSVYLLGTASGAALYQLFAPRQRFEQVLTYLLHGLATICLISIFLLLQAGTIYTSVKAALGGGFAGSVLGEIALAFTVFFLPTVLMGATFSHLAQAACSQKGGFGRALCVNTVGASLAPLLFGVLLLPSLGSTITLLLASISYLFLIPQIKWSAWIPTPVPIGLGLYLLFNPMQLSFVSLDDGNRVIKHVEGVMAAVTVVQDTGGNLHLKVNNHFTMGGTASAFSDRRQAHIPLLLHPNPKQALFLGLGTGATFAAAADHPGLEADGVELIPEIIPLLTYFQEGDVDLSRNETLHIKVADARRFVNACQKTYDVVVADLFHPARDGAGSLYTVEHFKAIKELLNPGGLFCQWLPIYQLDLEMLRVIIRTFLHVFPDSSAYLAHYSLKMPILGLIATANSIRYPADWLRQRVQNAAFSTRLKSLRLHTAYSLFGNFIANREDLASFAGEGAKNTDDRPLVVFGAPRFIYTQREPAHVRLLALINIFDPQPDHILQPAQTQDEQQAHARLASYWTARNRFLKTGVGVAPPRDIKQLLADVREPLLEIVRTSSDFDAAYDPLLAMAHRLRDIDPRAAKELLIDLEDANPKRAEARRFRRQLFNE
jgi:spermidine synthase